MRCRVAFPLLITCSGNEPVVNAPLQTSATEITETTFNSNWDAVSDVDGYKIDVAYDSTFLNRVPGYNNLDVGNVLTITVNKYDIDAATFIVSQEGLGYVFNDSQKNLISRLYREIKGQGIINNSENLISVTDFTVSSNIVSISPNGGASGAQAIIINNIQNWWVLYWGASWIGDSIISLWNTANGFAQVIDATNISPIQNLGIPDSTIARVDIGDSTFSMCNRYMDVIDGKGIIILSGGENDYRYQIPIGVPDSIDEYTFNGGLNKIITGMMDTYPDARIILTTPIQRSDYPFAIPFIDYVNAIIERASSYGLECWDMYNLSGISEQSAAAGVDTIDGIHPSTAGYNKMGNIISRFFNNVTQDYYTRIRAYIGDSISTNSNVISNDGQAMNHYVAVVADGGILVWDNINYLIKGLKQASNIADIYTKWFGFQWSNYTGYRESGGIMTKIYDLDFNLSRTFVSGPAFSISSGKAIATYNLINGVNTSFSETYFTGPGMPMTLWCQCSDINTPEFGCPTMLGNSGITVPFITPSVLNTTPENTEYAYRTDGGVFSFDFYNTSDPTTYNVYTMSLRLEQNVYLNGELKANINTGPLTFTINQIRTATGSPTDVFGGVLLLEAFAKVEMDSDEVLSINNFLQSIKP